MSIKSKCELRQALDGNSVPFVTRGTETFRLGSWYNGRYAAERWVASLADDKEMENVILFGLGDCQIVLRLLDRIPGYVLVYEPDAAIFEEVRRSVLFSKFRDKEKLYILYGEDQEIPIRDVVTDILNDDCVERTTILAHPGYLSHYPEQFEMLQDVCRMVCDAVGFTQGAIQRHMIAMVDNQLDNFPYIKDGIPVMRLAKYWDPEIPVILVSAGPSLMKNIEYLKQVKGKAFIFAVDAALPTLLRNGVVPDLVGSTDGIKKMSCFEEPGSYDIPYFVTSNTKNELMKKLTNRKIWGYDHRIVRTIMEKCGIDQPHIPSQFGIAEGMFALILELNVRTIILVGQDFAYSEDRKSHIGAQDEGFEAEKAEETEGYYGGKVYTRMDWQKFREWFEEMIALLPVGYQVINATEGGARIHGAVQQPLREVVESMPDRQADFEKIIADERVKLTDREYEKLMKEWKKLRGQIEKVRQMGYHKTFFETNFRQISVMDIVLGYMRYLKDVPDREERFRMATDYIYEQICRREFWQEGESH